MPMLPDTKAQQPKIVKPPAPKFNVTGSASVTRKPVLGAPAKPSDLAPVGQNSLFGSLTSALRGAFGVQPTPTAKVTSTQGNLGIAGAGAGNRQQYPRPSGVSSPSTPGAPKAKQLTLADLGLQGQVEKNSLQGGRGWYLPWSQNGVQGSLDWSTGKFYPAYPLADTSGGGGGGDGNGGGGGGGGGYEPRAGGFSMGLVNWRI